MIAASLLAAATLAPIAQGRVSELYQKSEHRIQMRDGVELYTAVYRPRRAQGPRPILFRRTPYSCRPYGVGAYPDRLGPSEVAMEQGYIVVLQDVRGRWMSDGTWDNMRPHVPGDGAIDESSDTYDTIDWLLENVEGHNGRVGMWGISYPGFFATAALPEAHPALVASIPQAPVADFYHDDFHHGGAFTLGYLSAMPTFGVQKSRRSDAKWYEPVDVTGDDAYSFCLRLGPLSRLGELLGEENFFFQQIAEHPDYDDFWRARSILPHLGGVEAAVLVVGGWYDAEDLYGPLAIYGALERGNPTMTNSLVIGPWGHGDWARRAGQAQVVGDLDFGTGLSEFYAEEIELPFLEHHLDDGPDPKLPEALVYDTGQRAWRRLDAWPPPTEPLRLYLRSGGRLAGTPPDPEDSESTSFVSDPAKPVPYRARMPFRFTPRPYMGENQAFAAARDDVLVFETAPLVEPITLAGDVFAHLVVSTTGTDADWVVKLIDGHPVSSPEEAFEVMVRSDVLRGRYRGGFDRAIPFEPGARTDVRVPLQDVLHTFAKGHRIVVHLQSSWFPLIDRNPQRFVENVYGAGEDDFRASEHSVFHAEGAASHLELRRLER